MVQIKAREFALNMLKKKQSLQLKMSNLYVNELKLQRTRITEVVQVKSNDGSP